jgi:hypothetical protein
MNTSRRGWRAVLAACVALFAVLVTGRAQATPWAEVGDIQLRSDIQVLAGAGLIDNVTMQWPMPWGSIITSLERVDDLDSQPEYVREAAERVETLARHEVQTDHMNYDLSSDFTNLPATVRGFDALGRQDVQGAVSAEWMGNNTAIRISVGAQTANRIDKQTLMLDGSYIAERVGGIAFYAGYETRWWGPGWDTALSISNNARPFPTIGYRRLSTTPFSWPFLRWLGPWNHEQFFGIFDDPRLARNTLFHATRFEFNPFKGFEFAIARMTEFCGTGHPCEPIAELLNVQNGNAYSSKSKDEVDLDFRYTNTFEGFTYEIYNQEMNRDTGPFVHSDTSHLFGASLWVPLRNTSVRLTAEYADTISTENFFSFGKDFYGITYNDYKYTDGWEYRGRTLGSSLDTDSRLASFHASWLGPSSVTYELTYYRAWIGSPLTNADGAQYSATGLGNRVSTEPVTIDIGEARLKVPLKNWSVELAVRLQDDQPRPDKGFAAAGELSINYRL